MSAVRRYLTSIRGFDHNVRLALASQGMASLSGGVWGVLANLYLLRLGYGPEFIGLVNFVLMLSMGAASLPGGELGRRYTTRRTVAWSAVASTILYSAFVAAWLLPPSIRSPWLLVTGTVAGVSFGIMMVNYTPMLADLSGERQRGSVFSVSFALGTGLAFIGALAGGALPSLAGAVLKIAADVPAAYGVSLLLAMATMLPCAILVLFVRESRPERAPDSGGTGSLAPAGAETGPAPTRALLGAATVMFCSWLGLGTVVTFWNVYLDQGLRLATPVIGTVAAVTQLVAIPVSLAAPLVMSRLGPQRAYPLALLGIAASMMVFGLATGPLIAVVAIAARFAFFSISSPTFATFSQSVVSPRWRGSMAGVVNTAYAGGHAVISLAGGFLVAAVGFRLVFIVGAAMVVASAALFWLLMGRPAARRALGAP
ncbi:MAG: MFS transporter [Anaerolineae bacterium]